MIRLKIDNNFVDITDIDAISLTLNIKNIKNYGKRNVSFSKPIKIIKTLNSEKVFKNLSNINTINGYSISDIVDGELQENGVTILKGTIKVEDFDDYYNVTISSSGFNLFNEMGDKLIVDNNNSDDDITFPDDEYLHTYDRDFVRTQLRSDPSNNGHGYIYPIIDYNNELNDPEDLTSDYVMLPAIAVRELFDGIFDKYDYTYELSDDISTYINKLYIPFNDDIQDYTTNWKFAEYSYGYNSVLHTYCGEMEVPPDGFQEISASLYPYLSKTGLLQGIEVSTGNFDYIYDLNVGDGGAYTYGYIVPLNGNYSLDINLLFGKAWNYGPCPFPTGSWSTVDESDMEVIVHIERNDAIYSSNNLGTINHDLEGDASTQFFSKTISNIYLEKNDIIYTSVLATDPGGWDLKRMAVLWDPSSNFSITEHNSFLGNVNSFELNDMRPKNLKQSEFINDIFKLFNCFIEIDTNNSKKLIIKSYNYYFADSESKDWTEKLDQSKSKTSSLKNEFAKQIVFTYTEDGDLFNKDFKSKYGYPFNYKIIENDSEFTIGTNEIKLSTASTVFKTIKS